MKNRIFSTLLLLTVITVKAFSQQISEKEIVGKWMVVKVNLTDTNIPKDQKEMIELLKDAFLKSSFSFKEDKSISFDFEIEGMQISKGHWKFNPSNNTLVIQEWKDRNTNDFILMEISIRKEGEKILFSVAETFLELEMKKM